MIKGQKHLISISEELRKKAMKRKRLCLVANCPNSSINSHLLWKSGILKPLATRGHLIEINSKNKSLHQQLRFVKTGINDILTFKGFCSTHDNYVFREIEQGNEDFNSLRTQILISVRGVYNETRKKEIVIEWQKELLKKAFWFEPFKKNKISRYIYSNELGFKDTTFYSRELNNEYRDPKGRFVFRTFQLDELPVVASSYFSIENQNTMKSEPLNSLFFSLFPFNKKSFLIIGFHTNYLQNYKLLNNLNSYNPAQIKKFISDVIIKKIESWACSIDFYQTNIKQRENEILDCFNQDFFFENFQGELDQKIPNLFEA